MPEEVIKQKGLLHRYLGASAIQMERKDTTDVLTFPASSEEPVERWYGMEVLSHDKAAVRLTRAAAGAMPLLFNHDVDDPIGMITGARVEKNRLMVDANLFASERAQQVKVMIDGGLRNVSLAYRVNVIEEDKKSDTFTVRDWEPLEVSIVTVPADYTVGIGRQESEYDVRMIRAHTTAADPATTKERTMPTETVVTVEPKDEKKKISAVDADQERTRAIRNLCKGDHIDPRVEERWIMEGTSWNEIADEILKVKEERGKQKPLEAARIGLTTSESRRYSIFNAVRWLRDRTPELREKAAFELECSKAVGKRIGKEFTSSLLVPSEVLERPLSEEAVKRAMTTTPLEKGGALVSTTNMGFIDILRNRSVSMAMGSRVLSGLQGNVTFARQTGKVTVTWQAGETTSITAADQALGQLSMTPKTCIAITDVSEQLLQQSSPSAESFVMADLARDVAIDGVDAAVINGTGGAQPLGIKNTTGVTTGQDSATATYAKILAFPIVAGGVNAIRGNPGFVTNIAGAGVLMQKQRFSSTDTPVWEGNLMDGVLVGFKAMASEQLASSNLIFGSWDEVVIGEWGVLELSTDNGGTRFNTATVGIRAMWMVDVMLRYPQAFVVSVNLSA
jgi:HK97 family phage major capsid protein/HK97 family phage prohead protease